MVDRNPVQGRDDVRDRALAVRVQHFERDDLRIRCDARLVILRVIPVAGDDARDMCPVAVIVVRQGLVVYEIHELRDPLVTVREDSRHAALGEVVVPCSDAGIDDSDADAVALQAVLLNQPCAGRSRRAVVVQGRRAIVVDLENLGTRLELLDLPVGQIQHEAVDDVQVAVADGEALELLRELRAGHQRHDDAADRQRIRFASACYLVIELVFLDVGTLTVGLALGSGPLRTFSSQATRGQRKGQNRKEAEDASAPPNCLASRL